MTTTKLKIEELSGAEAFEVLRVEWHELYRQTTAPPFLAWEWLATWQRWLNPHRTPLLLCARRAGQLVGVLPLASEERALPGTGVKLRRLSLLGEGFGGADYLDLLALPEEAEETTAALLDHLANQTAFELLELDGLAADSPTLGRLQQRFAAAAQFRFQLEERFVCPQVELAGDWPAVLKQSKRADNFKRRLKQLRQLEGFAYRAVTEPAEAEAAFERFLKLHEPRWAAEGGSDFTGHAALRAFHRDLVQRLSEAGLLRFDELWFEGECHASIYGLDDGARYCFYNSGYNAARRQLSPGLVLLGLSIEDAVRRGIRHYDFLRGDEAYKFDWSNGTRTTMAVRVARCSLPVTAWLAWQQAQEAIRSQIKSRLPEPLAAVARRWQRARRRAQGVGHAEPVLSSSQAA
jgi:CelD/BcsL family acetyltransferase involved in cellulose biosynthesis